MGKQVGHICPVPDKTETYANDLLKGLLSCDKTIK